MGFFDREPADTDDELDDDDDDPFGDLNAGPWIAGSVAGDYLVARSEQAAVLIRNIRVLPDGFHFTVASHLHRSVPRRRPFAGGHLWHDAEPTDPLPDHLLRIGIGWPDGGRAANIDGYGRRPWDDATEPTHGIEEHGGGGSDREYSQETWAWPVPTEGRLRFVVEWPAYGIAETALEIDAAAFQAAAAEARPVWEEDESSPTHRTRSAMFRAIRERNAND